MPIDKKQLVGYVKHFNELPPGYSEEQYFKEVGEHSPIYKPVSASVQLRDLKAQQELAKLKEPVPGVEVDGKVVPMTEETERLKGETAYIKARKERAKATAPPKGRTISEAGLEFAEETIKTKEAQEKLADLGDDMSASEQLDSEVQLTPTQEILARREAAYKDSARMLVNIQSRPDIFGDNPNVDKIFETTSVFEGVVEEYDFKVDALTEQIANELSTMGTSLAMADAGLSKSYIERKARENAESVATENILLKYKDVFSKYNSSLEDMQLYLQLVKGQ